MFKKGRNVNATIICEKGDGRPTQACLNPEDFFGKHCICKACNTMKL